jgi:phosphatidylinositol kinase/protein kinase (PI-3  family)
LASTSLYHDKLTFLCVPCFYHRTDLVSVIVKSGDDLRQEQLATQLIALFDSIFRQSSLPLWLRPYAVLATSSSGGLIETVPDAISIHTLKEKLSARTNANYTLRMYFTEAYGEVDKPRFISAQRNFVESLAAYSLVCYFLQIKDRHNGNILIDVDGHIIHIDYGFMLSSSPGFLRFEKAPFKLTREFVEVMGGKNSNMFTYFKTLFAGGFLEVRKHHRKFVSLVQMMLPGTKMACFQGPQTIKALEERFRLNLNEDDAIKFAESLVMESLENWRTDAYDNYQYYTQQIK